MITLQSHDTLLLLWKPSGIASTPGKELCIFDILEKNDYKKILQKSFDARSLHWKVYGIDLKKEILNYGSTEELQLKAWSLELLCNRIDTATSGYLLFAKDQTQKAVFETEQKTEVYQKYYLASVVGDIRYWLEKNPAWIITLPIMHHQSLADRMTCLQGSSNRGRGKPHQVSSKIEFISFDEATKSSCIKVMITKGIRHQIRVHLSTIGYPIRGDPIYGAPRKKEGELRLTSIGVEKKA